MLPVSVPFHCPLMMPAQGRLAVVVNAAEFADLTVPLINNWQAREIRLRRVTTPTPEQAHPLDQLGIVLPRSTAAASRGDP